MAANNDNPPQPISHEDAQRLWTLQKQNAPLSKKDKELLEQLAEWQMWTSHGIRLKNGSSTSRANSKDCSVDRNFIRRPDGVTEVIDVQPILRDGHEWGNVRAS